MRIDLRWRCTVSAWASVEEVTLNHVRRGSGRPLLLVHGLGAGWRSWSPIIDELAESREVIAVDLPGFGESPPLTGEVSIATLTDSVAAFIREQGLDGVSTVGQSMGGRMVLELARRGVGGDTVDGVGGDDDERSAADRRACQSHAGRVFLVDRAVIDTCHRARF